LLEEGVAAGARKGGAERTVRLNLSHINTKSLVMQGSLRRRKEEGT